MAGHVEAPRQRRSSDRRFPRERTGPLTQYYNPQQEPGSERRLLLVFVLTFVVLLIFQPLLTRYMRKQAPQPSQTAQQTQPPTQAPPPAAAPAPETAAVKPPAKAAERARTREAQAETETVVENSLYRITFTNRGGQVKSWILKNYKDDRGQPLDLVHKMAAEQHGHPLSLWTYDQALRNKLNSALYVPSTTEEQRAPAEVTFEYADQQTRVRKSFRFDHSYVVQVETSVEQDGQAVRAFPAWPAGFGDQLTPASYAASRIAWQHGDKVERIPGKKVSGGNTLPGPFQWAGVVDQYFGALFLPDDPAAANLITLRHSIQVPRDPKKPDAEKIPVELLGAAVGNPQGPTRERVFVGPKALDVLESVHTAPAGGQTLDLRAAVDFGFFGIIARPLFLWLRWTHEHIIANWGWDIVVLTVIINLVLFPLRLSSMKSAMKMQRIQPQVNAIKEKYKKYSLRDPRRQEMNQEIAALFKREGVNPAGGCLPLLIQMPFLFAFYSMLANAIELRHASWLWIRDLSSPDPYYVIPVLIVLTTYGMQKMTPQAGMDPAQQKVMTVMMPVMLGFISWTLSAGLGVYWILGNIIAIVQQLVLNRTHFGREMRAMAEKRARQRGAK